MAVFYFRITYRIRGRKGQFAAQLRERNTSLVVKKLRNDHKGEVLYDIKVQKGPQFKLGR